MTVPGAGQPACAARAEYRARAAFFDERAQAAPITQEKDVYKRQREGKEPGQGVAYLDDGTMIVVENGRRYVGETVTAVVTTVLQTSAGRMIFTRLKPADEKAG